MLWVGMVLGVLYSVRAARNTNIKADSIIDVALYGVVAGVIFAHIASILLDLPLYITHPSEILGLWSGVLSPNGGLRGLSFHGGLIGAVGTAYLYTRRKRINFLAMVDILSPGLAIAYGITRIGCFLNGCCYGIPTNLPWAVRFHVDGMANELTPPSHPTQIYAMLANFAIFGLLVMLAKRKRFTGQIFVSYLAMYSVYRFLNEFLRKGVTADVAFAGMTEAQIVSLIGLIITLPILWIKLRRPEVCANFEISKVEGPKCPS